MSILTILAILIMGALLGLMGGGGSILSVPIFIYLMELAEKEAIATSLLVVGTTSLFSLLIYLYKKQVDVRIGAIFSRSEEHTSELQSRGHLVCRLLLEKKE